MFAAKHPGPAGGIALALALALGGCGKLKPKDPHAADKVQAQTKLRKAACASATAYDRLKDLLFDQAIGAHRGDRANLDLLADYSVVRMEDPVVSGWDPVLDITRCEGRFILEIPPGAERAFGGRRRLEANIAYTAQAAADGNGFVYRQTGAEPIVAGLAAFNLASADYRPPPAIDEPAGGADAAPELPASATAARADMPLMDPKALPARSAPEPRRAPAAPPPPPSPPRPSAPERAPRLAGGVEGEAARPAAPAGRSGESTIRAFYGALGSGNGAAASAQIIPEKRSGGAYSAAAMSRFYGRLAEPIRLTGITPIGGGAWRVGYRYSAGRSRCRGDAIVRVTQRDGRDLIRSIQALSGC